MIQRKIYELGGRLSDKGPRQDPTQSQSRGSGEKSTTVTKNRSSKDSLNLLQWNAEGLGTHKVLELRKFLKDFLHPFRDMMSINVSAKTHVKES